jgi:methionyl-tRNA formyltransferase
MKKSLRVVFMGTPEFAAHQLQEIAKSQHQIVGVVTVPDKPAGRGRQLNESAVKKTAKTLNLTVLQPEKLKAPDFIDALTMLNADVFVVVAFRMLPKVVWSLPKLGTFNLHASLLPNYRGAAPINWAIINGETETGITTFLIDEKIDTGSILLKKRLPIFTDDTASTLHDRLKEAGGPLLLETLDGLAAKTLQPQPQDDFAARKEAPKLFKETCQIPWGKPAQEIINHVRGLASYPTAITTLETEEGIFAPVKIFKVGHTPIDLEIQIGEVVIIGKEILVGTGSGAVRIEQLQLPGKKPVDALSFINGSRFTSMKFL